MNSSDPIMRLFAEAFDEILNPTLNTASDDFFNSVEEVTTAVINSTPEEFEAYVTSVEETRLKQRANRSPDMPEGRYLAIHELDQFIGAYIRFVKVAFEHRDAIAG